jgi:hypothetical protein
MELVVMTLKTYFSTTPYGGGIGTVLTGSTVGNPNLKFEKQENLRLV